MRRMQRIGEERGKLYGVRQVINLLFIVSALAGMFIFFKYNKQTGTYILIAACILKFIEVTLRLMRI